MGRKLYNNKDIFLVTDKAFDISNNYRFEHDFSSNTLFIICTSRKKRKKNRKSNFYYTMDIVYGHMDRTNKKNLKPGQWVARYNPKEKLRKAQVRIKHTKLREYLDRGIIKEAVYSDIAELLLTQNSDEISEVIK